MDNDELLKLRRLATDALVKFADNDEVFQLAQALDSTLDGIEDYDSMVDKVAALEETNSDLEDRNEDLATTIRGIYEDCKRVRTLSSKEQQCEPSQLATT